MQRRHEDNLHKLSLHSTGSRMGYILYNFTVSLMENGTINFKI